MFGFIFLFYIIQFSQNYVRGRQCCHLYQAFVREGPSWGKEEVQAQVEGQTFLGYTSGQHYQEETDDFLDLLGLKKMKKKVATSSVVEWVCLNVDGEQEEEMKAPCLSPWQGKVALEDGAISSTFSI